MAFVNWTDELSVHVSVIDEQHKKLVGILNDIYDAMQLGQGAAIVSKILDNLVEYTIVHFSAEEKYMKEFNFKEYAAHKLEHENLVDQVKKFQADLAAGKVFISIEIMNFLRDWLSNHILVTDKKYTACFNQNGLK